MIYVPEFQKQLDGSPCGGSNCVFAAGSMAHNCNKRKTETTPAQLRQLSGDPCGGSDAQRVDDVLAKHFPPDQLGTGWFSPTEIRSGTTNDHKAFSAQVPYGPIADAGPKFSGQEHGFRGWHEILILPSNVVMDCLADGRRITVAKSPITYPQSLMDKVLSTAAAAFWNGKVHGSWTLPLDIVVPVHLRFGGTDTGLHEYTTRHPARIRSSPTVDKKRPKSNLVRWLPDNAIFHAAQTTKHGDDIGRGGHIWYGDVTGTLWIYSGAVS